MIYFLLYIVGAVDGIRCALFVTSITLTIVAGLVALTNYSNYMDETEKLLISKVKRSIPILLAMFTLACFIPSSKTIVLMLGGNATYQVLSSPEAKEIGGKTLKLLNSYLDEQLEEDEKK